MTSGSYILTVKNTENENKRKSHLQPIRVSYRLLPGYNRIFFKFLSRQILFSVIFMLMKLTTISFILYVFTAVRATPLFNNKPLRDRVPLNVFKYYRLVCQDLRKLVSISVKAISGENNGNENFNGSQLASGSSDTRTVQDTVVFRGGGGGGGEEEATNRRIRHEDVGISAGGSVGFGVGGVDMYVTNKYNGLVAVGRGDSVWRSSDSNTGRIDIHPSDLQV